MDMNQYHIGFIVALLFVALTDLFFQKIWKKLEDGRTPKLIDYGLLSFGCNVIPQIRLISATKLVDDDGDDMVRVEYEGIGGGCTMDLFGERAEDAIAFFGLE